jgi:hypothetical protein
VSANTIRDLNRKARHGHEKTEGAGAEKTPLDTGGGSKAPGKTAREGWLDLSGLLHAPRRLGGQ